MPLGPWHWAHRVSSDLAEGRVEPGRAVTRRAHGNFRVALFEEREVPARLKRDKRSRVAGAARLRKVSPVDRARRVRAVQDVPVREERFERRGVAAVAFLAADVVPAMSRVLPVGEMVRLGHLELGQSDSRHIGSVGPIAGSGRANRTHRTRIAIFVNRVVTPPPSSRTA